MRTYYKGGTPTHHSLFDNSESTTNSYPTTNGYFGKPGESGKSNIRQIDSSDPINEAHKFYDKNVNGGIETPLPNGK